MIDRIVAAIFPSAALLCAVVGTSTVFAAYFH